MISITVCDDDPKTIAEFRAYAECYRKSSGAPLDWMFLSDTASMDLSSLAAEDILILDIQMGNLNGIDLARELRKINEKNIIIFSTNYLEYALQGYEVAAFRYLTKPIAYPDFVKIMDEAIAQYKKSSNASIALRCGYQTEQVKISDILYCETDKSHVRITLADHSCLLANTGITALEKLLENYDFFRCHKACIVNLAQVRQPLKTDVLMKDGVTIPVSKHRMKAFMTALMKYWGGFLR